MYQLYNGYTKNAGSKASEKPIKTFVNYCIRVKYIILYTGVMPLAFLQLNWEYIGQDFWCLCTLLRKEENQIRKTFAG